MLRILVHLDADAFFASVEQAADSRLRGRPIAVGGEKRGIIASASYEARRYGVETPMPTVRARKLCPKLIVLPGDFEKYERFSRWMFSYAYDFTPDVEITSIDEGYFDLTGARQPATAIARTIRQAIGQSLKISVSEGIGSNKLVSQIASKLNKPAAFTEIPAGREIPFLHPLLNRWLPGVGPQTATRLNAAGLARIGQVAVTPPEMLQLLLGQGAVTLRQFANGIDDRPLVPVSAPAKSYGHQETFERDQTDEAFLEATLRRMADSLMAQVRADRKSIRTVTVKVRYNDMDEDQCGESLPEPTDLESDLYARVGSLLRRAWKRRVSLRLVSLKLSNVYDGFGAAELPLERETRRQEARRKLAGVIDELRHHRGRYVIMRGHDFLLREQPAGPDAAPPSIPTRPSLGARTAESASASPGLFLPSRADKAVRAPRAVRGIPLNVHSYYSFLDSTLSLDAIVGLARQHGLPALALTDQGNLHGAVAFTQKAKAAGIRPILGAELRVNGRPLCLYVENQEGYTHLCQILSRTRVPRTPASSAARAQPPPPRPSRSATLKPENADEGCERGRTGAGAELGMEELASRDTAGLLAVSGDAALAPFFPGRFYRAVSAPAEERNRGGAGDFSRVAVWPVHYATVADRWKFDIVQSIRTLTLLRQEHPEKRRDGDFHFRGPEEMNALFEGDPDPVNRTVEIAERCRFELPFHPPQFPAFHPPDGSSPHAFLRQLVFEGLQQRYASCVSWPTSQIEAELQIIHEVGYEEYFLVVWDILGECRRRGIDWITRGSAADSLVCYCLGISDVCPLRFNLYFRRFLNKERMSMNKLPDIDVDFPHDRKDDVLDLIFEKYGPEHAAVVGGFSTFQTRSAFAEIAKVLGVAERDARKFTEHFPWSFSSSEKESLGALPSSAPSPSLSPSSLASSFVSRPRKTASERQPESERAPLDTAPVAQVSQPAVSPISKSAKRWNDPARGGVSRRVAGLETRETADSEVRATGAVSRGTQSEPQRRAPPQKPSDQPIADARELSSLEKTLRASPDCRDLPLAEEPYRSALALAEFLDGFPRYPKMHPCGVVLSCQPIHDLTPTFFSHKGYVTTHFDMDAVEAIGLVKIDILAQGGLAVMRDVQEMLRGQGIEVDRERSAVIRAGEKVSGWESENVSVASSLPPSPLPPRKWGLSLRANAQEAFDNPEVWSLIASGDARAVHHIESPAMISLCRMSRVRDIDGLIAIVSVIRPGAANEQKKLQFTRRYQGLEPVGYPHPCLEPFLKSTFGLVVYEEHILQICETFAGMSVGRADTLRRALVKQKWEIIMAIEKEFAAAARARGHDEAKIAEVWALVEGFAGYAFCKAHSTAYGVEAYQSAWLKRYFPAEFMAGVLSNGKGFYHPLVYVLECHRLGVPLLPPWVNAPGPYFTVEGCEPKAPNPLRTATPDPRPSRAIRVPAVRVKGLTERTKERMIGERQEGPFESLRDFYRRVGPLPEEMEALLRAGAFDGFGQTRTELFWEIQYLRQAYGHGSGTDRRQGWLLPPPNVFGTKGDTSVPSASSAGLLSEPTPRQRLEWEQELFDFPVSSHPLALHDDVAWNTYCPVSKLGEHVGQRVVTCGLVVEQRVHHQATGEPMKFLTLADWTGMVETELFAATYRSYGLATVRYPVLEISATVEPFENGGGFTLRVHRAGRPRMRRLRNGETKGFSCLV
jgi:DNA polymerase III alpha subunit/nucleotidyltransferase/DNA polymerase involved in DNA repair